MFRTLFFLPVDRGMIRTALNLDQSSVDLSASHSVLAIANFRRVAETVASQRRLSLWGMSDNMVSLLALAFCISFDVICWCFIGFSLITFSRKLWASVHVLQMLLSVNLAVILRQSLHIRFPRSLRAVSSLLENFIL